MTLLTAEEVSPARTPCKSRLGLLLTLLASLAHPACAPRVVSSQPAPASEAPAAPRTTPAPEAEVKEVPTANSLVAREDELTFGGYTARRLHKTVKDAGLPGSEAEVESVLRAQPAYRFMYRQAAGR